MMTRNKNTARNNLHETENLTNNMQTSPTHANPRVSPPRDRRKGKDPIDGDQNIQDGIDGMQSQLPFEVIDPEAPLTQAQLAAMF